MLNTRELAELGRAKELLENPGLAIRIANKLGSPVEWTLKQLPDGVSNTIGRASQLAVEAGLQAALVTMNRRKRGGPSDFLHRGAVTLSGGLGGFFGLPGLAIELPASTVLILRSIADHARAQGENLDDVESRLNCLMVLALGGSSSADDAADSAYFAARIALAKSIAEAVEYIAAHGAVTRGAPALVRLVAAIAQRFGVTVSQKALAQAAPVIGAAGGAAVNLVFMSHFQDMALGHFTVRRLERKHGKDTVKRAYDALP